MNKHLTDTSSSIRVVTKQFTGFGLFPAVEQVTEPTDTAESQHAQISCTALGHL